MAKFVKSIYTYIIKIFKKIKKPKLKFAFTFVFASLLAIFYYFKLPCVYKYLFNVNCFGCGMTRAWLSVLSFDFVSAFKYHFMFWCVPILYAYFLFEENIFKNKKLNKIGIIIIGIGTLINWLFHLFIL